MRTSRTGSKSEPVRAAGFTLFETVALLFLLGLLAAITLPAFFRGPGGLAWRVACDQLERDLKTARATALARRQSTTVAFGSTGYTVFLGPGDPLARELPSGITVDVHADGARVEAISFGPDGASGAAVVELATGGKKAIFRVEEDGKIVRE